MSTGLHSIGVRAGAGSGRFPSARVTRMRPPALAAQLLAALAACGVLVLPAEGHAMSWLAGAVAGAAGAAGLGRFTASASPADESAPELVEIPELRVPELVEIPEPPVPELVAAPEMPVPEPAGSETAQSDPERPERPARPARPARSEAERRTERELAPLYDAGWRFVHDVAAPVGNFDHIAIGPAGVILIESRQPAGVVSIEGGAPVVTARPEVTTCGPRTDELHNLRPRTLADAAALREELRRLAGHRVWVQSMVVFWSEFPAGCVIDGRMVFIHGSRLTRWLSRRPPQLTATEIE